MLKPNEIIVDSFAGGGGENGRNPHASQSAAIERALAHVVLGILRIDGDGSIWKVRKVTNVGRFVDIEPRRAETKLADYLAVRIEYQKKRYLVNVHAVVWSYFNGRLPEPGMEINHVDGDKLNNHPDNLELVTQSENSLHAWRTGLKSASWGLTRNAVEECIRLRNGGMTYLQIAQSLGISMSCAWRACNGRIVRFGDGRKANRRMPVGHVAAALARANLVENPVEVA